MTDVDQPVGSREDLHEGAEIGDPLHLAEIDAIDLRILGELLHHRERLRDGVAARTEDRDTTVVLDVDLALGGLLDGANRLATWPDDVADPIRLDEEHLETGRIGVQVGARL